MPSYLRQATASQSRSIGPFLDDTDYKTAETALTVSNTDIKLIVNGGSSVNKSSGGGTHRINGHYAITFDANDTATVGELEVCAVVAGALPVFKTFVVVEEAVYDALFVANAPGYLAAGGAVGSVTAPVTVGTNNDKTGYVLSAAGSAPMTEEYRANGATGTLNQLLYELVAHLGESSINGTQKALKKLDHSSTAATYTLNSATTPTAITRAS